MKLFLLRLLKFFVKLGIVGKYYRFVYQGEGVSLNKFYSQGHWYKRQELKQKYKWIFYSIIKDLVGKVYLEKFYLLVFYNSRHDCDNVVGLEKLFMDCLKDTIVKGDDRRSYLGLFIGYDTTLPKNTFEFILIEAK